MRKIAIQGIKGSFHDIAAHQYYKDDEVELICCDTFEDIYTKCNYCKKGDDCGIWTSFLTEDYFF